MIFELPGHLNKRWFCFREKMMSFVNSVVRPLMHSSHYIHKADSGEEISVFLFFIITAIVLYCVYKFFLSKNNDNSEINQNTTKSYQVDKTSELSKQSVSGSNATTFYDNGNIEAEYIGDDVYGILKLYYEDGTIKLKKEYSNNKPHGSETYYYPDGKIQSIRYFTHGQKDGVFEKYDDMGNLLARKEYNNGETVSSDVYEEDKGNIPSVRLKGTIYNPVKERNNHYHYYDKKSNSFKSLVSQVLMHPFTFKGRMNRQLFMVGILICYAIAFMAGILSAISVEVFRVPVILSFVFIVILEISLMTRRLHDINLSGHYVYYFYLLRIILVIVLPILHFLFTVVCLIILCSKKGTVGINEYGEDPLC